MNAQPLIIIGAGRSGTNILRYTLVALPGFRTWDCDEINLIWRHGNINHQTDVLTSAQATPEVRRFIRNSFDKLARKTVANVVVEKTCANTLRVPFVEAVLPEARYIHIVRDGRDVALSSMLRWRAPVEPKYLLRKLRHVPFSDIPFHLRRFAMNRLHQITRQDKRQAVWGPIYQGMREDVKTNPLSEVCAKQWVECVTNASEALLEMRPEKSITVKYEDLVSKPRTVIQTICEWYEPGLSSHLPQGATDRIFDKSAGAWKKKSGLLTPRSFAIMTSTLRKFGYETAN